MNTNIKIIIAIVLFTLSTSLMAQNPLHFGIKAGANLSDYSRDIENNDLKVGYNAGITVDYRFNNNNFYLLSGLEVSSKGTQVKDRYPKGAIPTQYARDKVSYNPIYLQIPLHVGYRLNTGEDMAVLFHVGPYVAYGVGGKITQEIIRDEQRVKTKHDAFGNKGILKRWDFGMGLGTGFAFREFRINFGYDLGILNALKYGDESIKNNTAHVSVGYRFM